MNKLTLEQKNDRFNKIMKGVFVNTRNIFEGKISYCPNTFQKLKADSAALTSRKNGILFFIM